MATNTAGSTARRYESCQMCYLRLKVRYNDAGIGSGVIKGTLPQGAIIIGTDVSSVTAFNAGTTNVVTCGTNGPSTNNNIIAAADYNEAATGLTKDVSPTGTALGPIAADSPVYVMYTQSGTAASAGFCEIIIKYVLDNDNQS